MILIPRGQLSQMCDVYMHLTFGQNSELQLVLINRTFYANLHHQTCFIMILELSSPFNPCISQLSGFN